MKQVTSFILLCFELVSFGITSDTTNIPDFDTLNLIENQFVPNSFFKNRYKHYNLEQYLDNYQELVLYQNETVGDFSRPDQLTFSVTGNSYKWNKYYYDDFRINEVFTAGNSLYKPNLYNSSVELDLWNTSLNFIPNKVLDKEIRFQYNKGNGFGGTSPFTEDLIHKFHRTAEESFYIPVENQRTTKNAAELLVNYYVNNKDKKFNQSVQLNHGTRMWLGFDYEGVNRYYPEKFLALNLSGELPLLNKRLFDSNYYLLSHLSRDHMNSEFGYDKEETSILNQTNFSYYGKKQNNNGLSYTSGITVAMNSIRHHNLNFSRNFIDQDAEGVEPWYPDGNIQQFSHALLLIKKITKNFSFTFDGYNSLLNFTPSKNSFYNTLYYQPNDDIYQSLYIYQWNSSAFASGLIENTAGIKWINKDNKKLDLFGTAEVTLDGIFLNQKSLVRPNWQSEMRVLYKPYKFLELTFLIGKKRIPFHYEQVKFLSNNYLNGSIYYWNDINKDKRYQSGEQLDLFSTTGGMHHSVSDNLKQPEMIYMEFPFKFKIGKRHNIVFYNQYRKYVKQWRVNYATTTSEVGYYKDGIYFLKEGEVKYKIGEFESEKLTSVNNNYNILFNSPFFAGNTIKYQINGEKLFFSISWTYHQLIGLGSYGNGLLHNDLDVLSESQANPNSDKNGVVLLDSDRSFVGRLLFSYQLTKKISLAFSFKFKDGQVISPYATKLDSDNGKNQVAVWMYKMKGNNEFNGDSGNREDAFFNSVLRFVYIGNKLNANVSMYNIYDFGTDLSQYSFSPTKLDNRYSLELNIPRGLMITLGYKF